MSSIRDKTRFRSHKSLSPSYGDALKGEGRGEGFRTPSHLRHGTPADSCLRVSSIKDELRQGECCFLHFLLPSYGNCTSLVVRWFWSMLFVHSRAPLSL